MQENKVTRNEKYGYYEIANKPNQIKLKEYYSLKYYSNDTSKKNVYQRKYSDLELSYIQNTIEEKYYLCTKYLPDFHIQTALDIGCGEGYATSFLRAQGIAAFGTDFSIQAIENHNKAMLPFFKQGDVAQVLTKEIEEGKTYDLLWLDNVLEHVLDPEQTIEKCKMLLKKGGIIVVEVPNDFSLFQNFLKEKDLIDREYWVAPPDHLTYFSPDSLDQLFELNNWKTLGKMTNFPIELFCLNHHSNYVTDKKTGKEAHRARLLASDFLNKSNSTAENVALYEALMKANLGRQIVGVYQKK